MVMSEPLVPSCAWDDPFICATRLLHMCDTTPIRTNSRCAWCHSHSRGRHFNFLLTTMRGEGLVKSVGLGDSLEQSRRLLVVQQLIKIWILSLIFEFSAISCILVQVNFGTKYLNFDANTLNFWVPTFQHHVLVRWRREGGGIWGLSVSFVIGVGKTSFAYPLEPLVPSCAWDDPFMCTTRLLHMYDMTPTCSNSRCARSYQSHSSLHLREMRPLQVRHDSIICTTPLLHALIVDTQEVVRATHPFMCVRWPLHVYDTTPSYVRHDSYILQL